MKQHKGFTLLELIITVMIIAAVIITYVIFSGADMTTFETPEMKRNRVLERQAEAMEEANRIQRDKLEHDGK